MQISTKVPLLITLLCMISGCGTDSSDKSETSLDVDRDAPTLKQTATIDQVTHNGFRVTVVNNDEQPVCFDGYYFAYRLTAVYPGDQKRIFNYGADKVPVGYDADWQVLAHGQSFAWSVSPPTSWDSLTEAVEIRYECVMQRQTPRHVTTDPRKIDSYSVLAQWAKHPR